MPILVVVCVSFMVLCSFWRCCLTPMKLNLSLAVSAACSFPQKVSRQECHDISVTTRVSRRERHDRSHIPKTKACFTHESNRDCFLCLVKRCGLTTAEAQSLSSLATGDQNVEVPIGTGSGPVCQMGHAFRCLQRKFFERPPLLPYITDPVLKEGWPT